MTKNLFVYNASAGSGKTYTLALEYLALALDSDNPRYFSRILAITFTNKAAFELKERIIQFAQELGQGADKDKEVMIIERTGLSAHDIQQRAQLMHQHMLFDYGRLHISTIDSFVLSILRSFSKEIGLGFDFDIELDTARIKDMLVESILSQVGQDRFITQQLVSFVQLNLDDGSAWDPKGKMLDALGKLMAEENLPLRERLADMGEAELESQVKALSQKRNQLWQEIYSAQASAQKALDTHDLQEEDFVKGKNGFIGFKHRDLSKSGPSPSQHAQINGEDISSAKAKKKGLTHVVNGLQTELKQHFDLICAHLEALRLRDNLYKNRMSTILALRLATLLDRIESEQGLALLSDNNRKISALVKDNPAPFIYERVGERYRHFLIDEFQDTSVLQWHNLLPLIDNSLASAQRNFLVGDTKQSIYRWRGGEVDQMVDLPGIIGSKASPHLKQIEEILGRNLYSKSLEKNFRSSPSVIRFNNTLFSELREGLSERYKKAYKDVTQKEVRTDEDGFVQCRLLEPKTNIREAMPQLLETLQEIEADGYARNEICVIYRRNAEGREIASFLSEASYDINSSESLLLSAHRDVHLVMSALDLLIDPQDVRASLFTLHTLLEKKEQIARFPQIASELKSSASKTYLEAYIRQLGYDWNPSSYADLDIFQVIRSILHVFSLDEYDPYIQELLSAALAHLQRGDGSLSGFSTYWQDKKSKLALSAGENPKAVHLMTVHKSKGLQFPVVVLPLIDWTAGRKTKDDAWLAVTGTELDTGIASINSSLSDTAFEHILDEELEKSQLDELNTLYVACTRPEDRLYMHVSDPGRGGLAQKLRAYIEQHGSDGLLTVGRAQPRLSLPKSLRETIYLSPYPKAKRQNVLSLAISRQERNGLKRALGDLVHRGLERCTSQMQISDFVYQQMSVNDYSDEDRSFVGLQIKNALAVIESQHWDSGLYRQYNEAELSAPSGKTYRIDRLYLSKDGKRAIVVDFKTGLADNQDQRQVQGYLNLIQAMGIDDAKGYLLYTQEEELVAL